MPRVSIENTLQLTVRDSTSGGRGRSWSGRRGIGGLVDGPRRRPRCNLLPRKATRRPSGGINAAGVGRFLSQFFWRSAKRGPPPCHLNNRRVRAMGGKGPSDVAHLLSGQRRSLGLVAFARLRSMPAHQGWLRLSAFRPSVRPRHRRGLRNDVRNRRISRCRIVF